MDTVKQNHITHLGEFYQIFYQRFINSFNEYKILMELNNGEKPVFRFLVFVTYLQAMARTVVIFVVYSIQTEIKVIAHWKVNPFQNMHSLQ